MKISDYLRRAAINNTWGTLLLNVLACMVAIVLALTHLIALPTLLWCIVALVNGWTLAMWCAAWIAQVAETNPELLDE